MRPTRPNAPPVRMHLFVEGRVQGVWFRDTVYHQATAGGVSGWVLPQHATRPKAHQSPGALMAECARCGKCCQLIGWSPETGQRSWEEVETLALGGHPDAMFMVAHWRYCWGTGYYWCDCFDFETHLCTVHEQKPKVCSDYPYYGCDALPSKLHDGCAFAQAGAPPLA